MDETFGNVRARRFTLVDDKGRVRGYWSADLLDHATLCMSDGQGNPRLTLVVAPDGSASVQLFDRHGKERAEIRLHEAGPVWLRVTNPYGRGTILEAP